MSRAPALTLRNAEAGRRARAPRIAGRAGVLAAVFALMWASPPQACAAAPAQWKDAAYTYRAQDTALGKLLLDFSRSNGVALRLSGQFVQHVSGRLHGASADEFLDRLAASYRFDWYVQGNVLYISPSSDAVVERIEVSKDSLSEAKAALVGVGLFEPRFGWGELPEEGVVTISGPREYVRQVRELIGQRDRSGEYEAMVFRLKHAAVDDRSVTIRSQTVVTPGVASLLKGMLASTPAAAGHALIGPGGALERGASGSGNALSSTLQNAFGTVPSSSGGADNASNIAMRTNAVRASSGNGPVVEGDVRTNSIVVFDLAKKRRYYQKLIDSLDIRQQLVEIEAYIIDVDRDRISELGIGVAGAGKSAFGVLDASGVLKNPLLGGGTLIVGNLGRFISRIDALEGEGQARVLAKPSVVTLENMVAVLDLSQTVYLRATGERVASIEPVTAGMLLRVTPRVTKEKAGTEVHLTVDIEDGKITEAGVGADTGVLRSTISTQAVLRNEQSLIIGGYNADSSSHQDSGVPKLSKIPLLGALFSGSKSHDRSRQRLFVLTPRLVSLETSKEPR